MGLQSRAALLEGGRSSSRGLFPMLSALGELILKEPISEAVNTKGQEGGLDWFVLYSHGKQQGETPQIC